MSANSFNQLLLTLCSPSWDAGPWLAKIPRKKWPDTLPLLWKLAQKVEKGALLKSLTSSQKDQLLQQLRSLTPRKKGKRSDSIKLETLFLIETASLRIAEQLGKKSSWIEKRKWCLRWFNSPAFLKLTEGVLFSDECIDRVLGLFERKVQHRLKNSTLPQTYQEEALYLDLDPEDLYTPYRVICRWGKSLKLKPGTKVVDLGSGVGRIPLTLGLLYPKVQFTGIEIMRERHEMAEKTRCGLKLRNVSFVCRNAAKRGLPIADYYYFFNPFVGDTLRQVFRQLKQFSSHRSFKVAVAQIELPWKFIQRLDWLKPVQEFSADKAWEGIGITVFSTSAA
jgi:SAM-dependent methyltransferase